MSIFKPGYEHSRKVTQFHYTAWPDRGIPELEMSLLSFYRRVKAQYHPFREPMLIHCRLICSIAAMNLSTRLYNNITIIKFFLFCS